MANMIFKGLRAAETPEGNRWTKFDENPFCKVQNYELRPSGKEVETAIYRRLDEIDASLKAHKAEMEILEVEYNSLVEHLKQTQREGIRYE